MNHPLRALQAAQYLRMSTDQQDLSIDLQRAAIERYARVKGLTLVATYQDEAKSGLRIVNRLGMRQLVADVVNPECAFATVLVYDVSRWGRFQNTDASAYYEYHCLLHGVQVVYVAEAFSTEPGPFSALLKNLKRAMAAEYSRELAVKVRAGIERVVSQGYSVGGQPAIGLVRQAVSRDGLARVILRPGERKAIQSDRVKLVHGSDGEIELVRRIFDLYANTTANVNDIVRLLETEDLRTGKGGRFTRGVVDSLLTFEPFVGNYVWGKLVQTPAGVRRAPTSRHLRFDNALDPIIDRETWDKVQSKLVARSRIRRGEERLLNELATALRRKPDLTGPELASYGCAPSQTYLKAFGSMEAAYALAGRTNDAVQRASRTRTARTKDLTRDFQRLLADRLMSQGCEVASNLQAFVLTLNGHVRLQVYLSWQRSFTREPAWFVQRRRVARTDWRLVIRLNEDATHRDYFLVPEAARSSFPMLVYDATVSEVSDFQLSDLDRLVVRLGLVDQATERTGKKSSSVANSGTSALPEL